jgi:hypothetical protein
MRTLPGLPRQFVLRLCLGFLAAIVAHQFHWMHLRFATSQIILAVSGALGMAAERVSNDTINVQGHAIQFTVACTLIEVMLGIQPLIWLRHRKLLHNFARVAASMAVLSGCNILRIEAAQVAFHSGLPWMLAHDIPLGVMYFAIWVVVWRMQSWRAADESAVVPQSTPDEREVHSA